METRRLITGLLLAMAVFLAYQWILAQIYPPPKRPPATQPAAAEAPAPPTAATPAAVETPPSAAAPSTEPVPRRELVFAAGQSTEPVTIGGRSGDALELTLTPRGGGVESLRLTARKDNRYVHRAQAAVDEPYPVLDPVFGSGGVTYVSYATYQIRIEEQGNRKWRLDRLVWSVAESSAKKVAFATALRAAEGDDELLRLTKTYELQPGQPLVDLELVVENTSGQPLTVFVEQNGPVGIRRESPMYDMRRLMAARRGAQAVEMSKAAQRQELRKQAPQGETLRLYSLGEGGMPFAWTALANRFFAVFTRSLPVGDTPTSVQYVGGTVALPESDAKLGDLVARMTSSPMELAPGAQGRQRFEIYAGPKDPEFLEAVNPDFVDSAQLNYTLAQAADSRCCTFEPLPQIMTGLLHWIHFFVRNYGIAIIILVLIVRTCLHPLTVYQQKQMFRMQDGMARLQPKMQEIKERYANDKVKQNQEMMKLYSEEGVNPMAGLVGMLPLVLQMPILVALWTGLNTDINLRHAPFDGWWIRDLAAPDALLPFDPPLTIPILGHLPLLGWMFTGIPALNLLPLLMGISMWLQQKYMPKPGAQAKAEAGKQHPPKGRKPGQMTPEEQLRQQRMIGYMMTIMFPLMFYYMPAGLNLYWMATNVFGIGESLIIRKQLKEEKQRRAQQGPKPAGAKKPGLVGRALKRLAEQAEDIQRKADQLATKGGSGRSPKGQNQKKR